MGSQRPPRGVGFTLPGMGLIKEGFLEEVMLNWILNDEHNSSDRQRVPVGKHVQSPKGLKPPQELRSKGVESW